MKIKKYATIILGSSILSFGIYNIHSPSDITEGGVLGLILLLEYWFKVSPAISSFVIDTSCFLIGYKVLGGNFLTSSLLATCSFSITYRMWQLAPPILPNFSAQPLVAAILGGVFVGIGVGLCVKQGAAAGADDTLALMYAKFCKSNVARFYIMSDITILTLSISYIPIEKIFFSFISVLTSSFIISKVSLK